MNLSARVRNGFTIVELLIVIVVIGILAALVISTYSGVQNRAHDAAVQSDLEQFAKIMGQQKALNGTYPTALDSSMGIKFSRGSYGLDYQNYNARYCYNSATDDFILYANSKSGNYFKATPAGVSSATSQYGYNVCSQVGLTTTNPSQNGLYQTTWSSWVN